MVPGGFGMPARTYLPEFGGPHTVRDPFLFRGCGFITPATCLSVCVLLSMLYLFSRARAFLFLLRQADRCLAEKGMLLATAT